MDIILVNSTTNEKVNHKLNGLIGIFETMFPNKISGYYVEGSYSDRTGIETSDIDMTIMFKRFLDYTEQKKAYELLKYCSQISSIELDVEITDEEMILKNITPNFKFGSFLAYGKDIQDQLPLMSIEDWVRERMHASYWLISKVFKRLDVISLPLDFPKPEEEFYGYTQRKLKLATGEELNCTRDLIRVIGWAATALVAYKAKKYIARKKDCHIIYRETIGDKWSGLIENIYMKCRNDWNYLIPDDVYKRKELRDICLKALEFENHFLDIYKEFLLAELNSHNAKDKLRAIWILGQIPFMDKTVINILYKLMSDNSDQALLSELDNTLKKYNVSII